MKAISVHEPYATLLVLGLKVCETRTWNTVERGRLAIAAAARQPHGRVGPYVSKQLDEQFGGAWFVDGPNVPKMGPLGYPLHPGHIVGTVMLDDVVAGHRVAMPDGRGGTKPYDPPSLLRLPSTAVYEHEIGDFGPGMFAWSVSDPAHTTKRCPACNGSGRDVDCPDPLLDENDRVGCRVCDGAGHCHPVRAKGRQRLWTWEP